MDQTYTDPIALERMGHGNCPECGLGPDTHDGWGGRGCSLTDYGVALRLYQFRQQV